MPSILDSCNVNNGGCDKNADCSHDKTTFAVVCTCKTGYSNVGTDGIVKCDGMFSDVLNNDFSHVRKIRHCNSR